MHRTAAELQMQPITLTLPAYRIAQLHQLAADTNAQHETNNGYSPNVSAASIASAILIQALDRITQGDTTP
jgi:hypothetical protein